MTPIRVFNRTLHRELWEWMANNPGSSKYKWPGWEALGVDGWQFYWCFACHTAGHTNEDFYNEMCSECPLEWGSKNPCGGKQRCHQNCCEYAVFIEASSKKDIREAAYAIANVKLDKDDRFITIEI